MVTIKNLSHRIQNTNILQDINITLPKNKLTAFIGANGAGKSTLLNVMARLLPLQTGQVLYDDVPLQGTNNAELAKVLSILGQNTQVNSHISVFDLLVFGRYPHHKGKPTSVDFEVIEEQLLKFNLQALKHRYVTTLSGGQRQRAFIAMVFCQKTRYVLLDEPLNNLDLYHAKSLMNIIKDSVQEQTCVVVIHDINQAIEHADHLVALHNGKVLFEGHPHDVITPENMHTLFNVEVDVIEHKGKVLIV